MLPIPSVVEVNETDLDVRLEVLNCLLQSNDVPFHRNVFFDGAFFASSRSRIPVQNAEACLLK